MCGDFLLLMSVMGWEVEGWEGMLPVLIEFN